MGILLAVLAVVGVDKFIDLSGFVNTGMIGGTILLVVMVAAVVMVSIKKAKNANEKAE